VKGIIAALALFASLAMTHRAHAVVEGKYVCMTDYAAAITSDDPPFVGRVQIDPNRGFGKFFVTIVAYSRLSAEDELEFRGAIEGTGFVVDSLLYVARFERGASIDELHNMAFGHLDRTDKPDGDAPHIYRSRFGGVFWLAYDNGFTAFVNTVKQTDVVLRGRCALIGPP
jgi:hypothetical protein